MSQNEHTIALEVFHLLPKNPLIFFKENKRNTTEEWHSFRKWLYTYCQMISRGEGMTSLHLKTNKEETILTFLLVSGFPQKHWQIYPRVISPVSVQYTWESFRKQGDTESTVCFRWAILLPITLHPAFLHTWINFSVYLCTAFSCFQIVSTWC